MSKVIEVRREILKNIEKLAEDCADVMHYLEFRAIYERLVDKMGEDAPILSELENILNDLAKAQNDFRKDSKGYFWSGLQ